MNIFYTDHDPITAAQSLPDRHIVKMSVEAVQMLVSACLRHDVQPNVITSKGTIHKGGYHRHSCTVWAGDTSANAAWTWAWGMASVSEYTKRYGKTHFAEGQLRTLRKSIDKIAYGEFTNPAQAWLMSVRTPTPWWHTVIVSVTSWTTRPGTFVWNKGTPEPSWLTSV